MAHKKRVERPTFTRYEKPSFKLLSQESNEMENRDEHDDEHVNEVFENLGNGIKHAEDGGGEQMNEDSENEEDVNEDEQNAGEEEGQEERARRYKKVKQFAQKQVDPKEKKVEREKRETLPTTALKSPFMNIVIDAKTMLGSEERLVAAFVFNDHRDKNVVFFKNHNLTLSNAQLETLRSNLKVDVEVTDIWAMMLNRNEKFKSHEAKSRLLFSTKPCVRST
ncbi:unnamed protein product [Cuscuta europaea]|uniref:Uncharacterized protein n=1 Tax=Cuscuta europaea TaxID=41803 RepID=A0A9P1E0T0_CUSEU|nr:unnamed protein product [Cuscuta europaea]